MIWNQAKLAQQHLPRRRTVFAPVGPGVPIGDSRACGGCGYLNCCCPQPVVAPAPPQPGDGWTKHDRCAVGWTGCWHLSGSSLHVNGEYSMSEPGERHTVENDGPGPALHAGTLGACMAWVEQRTREQAKPAPKTQREAVESLEPRAPQCCFCDGYGVHQCPGGDALVIGHLRAVFPGLVDAEGYNAFYCETALTHRRAEQTRQRLAATPKTWGATKPGDRGRLGGLIVERLTSPPLGGAIAIKCVDKGCCHAITASTPFVSAEVTP